MLFKLSKTHELYFRQNYNFPMITSIPLSVIGLNKSNIYRELRAGYGHLHLTPPTHAGNIYTYIYTYIYIISVINIISILNIISDC